MNTYKELKNKVNQLRRAYEKGSPEVPDSVYDAMFNTLKQMENEQGYRDNDSPTVVVGESGTDKHPYRMYSLANVFNIDEFMRWYKGYDISFSYKLDGASLGVVYNNGLLQKVLTRGDGITGIDVTHLKDAIVGIPDKIGIKELVEVKGEVVMTKEDFKSYNESQGFKYSNARNLTASSLSMKYPNEVKQRNLKFIVWGMDKKDDMDHRIKMNLLRPYFKVVESTEYSKEDSISTSRIKEDISAIFKTFLENREKYPFEVDGVVGIYTDPLIRKQFGHTNKHPRYAIAYKFPYIESYTILRDVKWQLGRTGVLTPVAVLDPVVIDGVTVDRATLHNIKHIENKNIHIGDEVVIIRSGDVIPKIIGINKQGEERHYIKIPHNCPSCNNVLDKGTTFLRCLNDKCEGKKKSALTYFVSKDVMDIKDIGPSIIDTLYTEGIVKEPIDFFKGIEKETLIPLFGELISDKILKSIEESRNVTYDKFIKSLMVDNIGSTVVKKVYEQYKTLFPTKEELLSIKGIGEIIAENYYYYITLHKDMIEEMMQYFNIEYPSTKSKGTVVITGTFDKPRKELVKEIESKGYEVSNKVKMDTKFLLVGEKPGSKVKDAEKYNVKIIKEVTELDISY